MINLLRLVFLVYKYIHMRKANNILVVVVVMSEGVPRKILPITLYRVSFIYNRVYTNME